MRGRLRKSLENRLRQVFLKTLGSKIFGTVTVDSRNHVRQLPTTEFSVVQLGMHDLELETYKFPVSTRRTSSANGTYRHGGFRYARFRDAALAGDGRVLDKKGRLVLDSTASHPWDVNNPGWFRTRRASYCDGTFLNLNWWPGNNNFYHWNRDVLSRAFVLTDIPSNQLVKLVTPRNPLPYHTHSLNRLTAMFPNCEILTQGLSEWWRVAEVIVPSQAPYLIGSGFLLPAVADFVRDVNLQDVPSSGSLVPFLYISREKTRSRRVLDERELIDRLSEQFPMTVVNIEDLSLMEQMSLMQAAEVVIGPFGSGLTNILFTKRRGLVELHNGDSKESLFATLALGCRCPYEQVNGGPSDERQDFAMTEAGITRVVEAVQRVADRTRR